ncbi:TPA: hypothetical protein PVT95_002622 [Escherichia coli]|uniref:hypothetical protein n=1 Tax=Escherichia coli TaxID=562 RepID=UPI00254A300A|nr:hypothetical protein [Escherichia coli]HDL0060652.1 hypothetical protein [Escherichia coli]
MSTITKEWLQQKISDMEATRDDIPFGPGEDGTNTLAALRIALASLEAEPVAYMHRSGQVVMREECCDDKTFAICCKVDTPLYTAPPALVANIHPLLEFAREYIESWDLGMAGDSSLLASAKKAIADSSAHQPAPAPVNAEPVAWLWSHRKHPSEVTLVRPEDDERAEGAHWSGWSCQALYAAPPAPVSVPTFDEWLEIRGNKPLGWVKDAMRESYDACRAAMLDQEKSNG